MMGFTSKYRQGIVTTCKGNICELTKKLILFSLPLRMKMYSYMSYYDKLEVSQTDTQPQIYIYALESAKSCLSCNYCQLIVAFTIYKIYVVRKEERKHPLEHGGSFSLMLYAAAAYIDRESNYCWQIYWKSLKSHRYI